MSMSASVDDALKIKETFWGSEVFVVFAAVVEMPLIVCNFLNCLLPPLLFESSISTVSILESQGNSRRSLKTS